MVVSGAGPAGIFISYRRADASWPARWLAGQLGGQFGAGVVFQDVDSIQPGDDFAAEIEAAVGACSVLLALIGPHWLTAEGEAGRQLDDPQDWVRLEIEAAIKRGVRVIPVLVDGARMPAADQLPPSLQGLARRQSMTLSPASLDISRLLSVLETALTPKAKKERQVGKRPPGYTRPARLPDSGLLVSAIQAALTLSGEAKARALTPIIRAAAVADPERVGWLANEAETAVRSIGDPNSRSHVLTEVAGAVAAADPDRGIAIARSIEWVGW